MTSRITNRFSGPASLAAERWHLAGIRLYLQLGFEPLVRGDTEREVWERVIRLLGGSDPYREEER